MTRVLFVTWDGPAQRYLEDLFLPIFTVVSERGALRFDVLQFTWGDRDFVRDAAAAAAAVGVGYRAVPVIRRPLAPATAAMIGWGAVEVLREASRRGSAVLFPRSIIPAGMTLMALRLRRGLRFSFDADGLMADERVDFGGWSARGAPYRVLREIESQAVREADGVLVRTAAAKTILLHRAGPGVDPDRIVVAANPRDADRFHPGTPATRLATRAREGVPADVPWLVYAGSLGPQYYPRAMLEVHRRVRARAPGARLHVLTGQPEVMAALLEPDDAPFVTVRRVPNEEVGRIVAAADLGLALRAPAFSQAAVAPIKLGEYLLAGTPVLSTVGVGDVDRQLEAPLASVAVADLGDDALDAAVGSFLTEILPRRDEARQASRALGLAHFGMDACARAYLDVLQPRRR